VSEIVLAVEKLQAGYEPGAPIVRGVTFEIERAEIVALLGPNGAGKSTLVRAIAGLLPKFGGTVRLMGRDITTVRADKLARGGLGFVPQTENVFTLMSIADNLRLAADILPKSERTPRIDAMYQLFPDLGRQHKLQAGRLSGGQRQMLGIARALIPVPRLLMLDEASAGLSPRLVGELFSKLLDIQQQGVTIVLVEQNAKAALAISRRTYILSEGVIVHAGASADLAKNPSLGKLFFGLKSAESGV